MTRSPFDPGAQDIDSKVIVALERLSEAFRVALWDEAKQLGLSPIQIQLLIFMRYHQPDQCKVSYLAHEFNLTKPTISDAVKLLETKALIVKTPEAADSRSYRMALTDAGRALADRTAFFASAFRDALADAAPTEKETLYLSLVAVIGNLNRRGLIVQQRMCLNCRFFSTVADAPYCTLLQQSLANGQVRVDCPEFDPTPDLTSPGTRRA
jgi:DNA-binding MarR family transcriptional regulator